MDEPVAVCFETRARAVGGDIFYLVVFVGVVLALVPSALPAALVLAVVGFAASVWRRRATVCWVGRGDVGYRDTFGETTIAYPRIRRVGLTYVPHRGNQLIIDSRGSGVIALSARQVSLAFRRRLREVLPNDAVRQTDPTVLDWLDK